MGHTLCTELARLIDAHKRCVASGSEEWAGKHQDRILALVQQYLPYGAGFDCGTSFDGDASTSEKLVFHTSFHHMNGNGYYDGWTEHTVTVRPSLVWDFVLSVSGPNRNLIKDDITEGFEYALSQVLPAVVSEQTE